LLIFSLAVLLSYFRNSRKHRDWFGTHVSYTRIQVCCLYTWWSN